MINTSVALLGRGRAPGTLSAFLRSFSFTFAEIGPDFWKAEVIGNFPEPAARYFLEQKLKQQASSSVLDDQAWRKVFKVRWLFIA